MLVVGPAACLRLLDLVVAPAPARVPHRLAETLAEIAAAEPQLRGTLAWRRLDLLTR